ncbi:probable glutamate receptor [Palaemon carinicauda]|uniref:probable glutamate receptor n=1 Tax=Palaemon carinicauda TaxID=392227 RepID=UPI0035B5FF2B
MLDSVDRALGLEWLFVDIRASVRSNLKNYIDIKDYDLEYRTDHEKKTRWNKTLTRKISAIKTGSIDVAHPGDRHLRVAVGTWHPWTVVTVHDNGTISAHGIAVEIFETIIQKMNYSHSYVTADDGEWGRLLANGSWTGMIGMAVEGKTDAVLGPVGVTWVRNQVVDYTTTLYFDYNGIFLPKPIPEKDLSNFLKPLSVETWAVLVAVLGLSIIVGLLFNHILMGSVKDNLENHQEMLTFKPVWILSNLLSEPSPSLPTTDTGRVFIGTWLITAFIIDTAYVGVLTSILVVPRVPFPVDSLEDLVSYGKIPWALERGTALHQLFLQATEGIYKEIFEKKSYMVYGCYETKERIKTERIAVLCDALTMRKAIHDDFSSTGQCNFHIARKPIFGVSIAYVFPKKSRLTGEFNKWLTNLDESGIVLRSVLKETSNATHCESSLKRRGPSSPILGFMDLAGMFLLCIGGLLLSTVVLVAEVIIFHLKLLG